MKTLESLQRLTFCSLLALLLAGIPAEVFPAPQRSPLIAQIEFRDITVADALRILSEQSDINVLASAQAAKVKMTLFLRNVRPMEVLEAMAKTYNLWYQRDPTSGIVRLFTLQEFRLGDVNFKDEQTHIFTLKNAKNALDLAYSINDLYGDRVRLSMGSDENEIQQDLSSRFARFGLIDSQSRLGNMVGGAAAAAVSSAVGASAAASLEAASAGAASAGAANSAVAGRWGAAWAGDACKASSKPARASTTSIRTGCARTSPTMPRFWIPCWAMWVRARKWWMK